MPEVGGEIDAFCTRCQLSLAHTVHAVVGGKAVKVECNTCHVVHRYRSQAAAPRTPTARRAPAALPFDALLAANRVSEAIPYSPSRSYSVGDVVDHSAFGRGFVSAIRDAGKVEVTFRSDIRILVHGRR